MIFFWTKSDRIGSKIIRWGLDEPSSHFAVCFFEDGAVPKVIESRLNSGVAITNLSKFLEHYTVVYALQCPTTEEEEMNLFLSMCRSLEGKEYDQWAIAYWFFAGLAKKMCGCRLPLRNQWGKNELVYCVEVLEGMTDYLEEIGVDISGIDLEMTSPEMAFNLIADCGSLIDITEHFV